MEQAITYGDFKGGISDSYSLGAVNQFQDCVQVDFQSEPNGLKLWPLNSSVHTTSAQVTGFVNLAVTWVATGIFAHTADGKIYDTSAGGATVVTVSGWPRIFFIVPRNESGTVYNYIFCEGKIHRATSDFSTITLDYKTFSGQPTSHYEYGNTIFFASSNFIYSLDFAGTLETEHAFPGGKLPQAMTFFQDTLRVYSNDQMHGWLDVFAISDLSAFQYEVRLDNNPVLGAVNSGSFDYVIAGKVGQGDVYVSSGTQLQLLKSTNEGTATSRDFNGKCDARLGDPYFVCYNLNRGVPWTENGIWAFTKGMPGTSQALYRPFDNATRECSAVHCTQSYVYYGYRDASNAYRVGRFETATPPTYSAEGYVTTMMTDFGDPFELKRITKIEIAYDCDNSNPSKHGWEIEIYGRKERSDAWTLLADTGTLSDVGKKEFFDLQSANFGEWHSVEFKILLKSANGTYSPLLKALRVTVSKNG